MIAAMPFAIDLALLHHMHAHSSVQEQRGSADMWKANSSQLKSPEVKQMETPAIMPVHYTAIDHAPPMPSLMFEAVCLVVCLGCTYYLGAMLFYTLFRSC